MSEAEWVEGSPSIPLRVGVTISGESPGNVLLFRPMRTNTTKRWWTITIIKGCALLLVASLIGCATPKSRIQRNQELFDTFPPDIQEKIRAGEVDLGFDQDMVSIALGKPDREYTRRTQDGTVSIWSYTQHYTQTRRQLVDGQFRVRDSRSGQVHQVRDSVWVDVPTYYEYDRLRLEFDEAGLVSAIEQVQP